MFTAMRVMAIFPVFTLGVWLSYYVLIAMQTGTVNVHNQKVERRTRPGYDWTAVLVQAGFAVSCFIAVAQSLLQ